MSLLTSGKTARRHRPERTAQRRLPERTARRQRPEAATRKGPSGGLPPLAREDRRADQGPGQELSLETFAGGAGAADGGAAAPEPTRVSASEG